ncbi:MAG: FMN-binding negative transcriptional regulator [Acidimicrobiales bacterium]
MYVPSHFTADEAAVRQLLADPGTADLVTATPQGMLATFLPILYEPAAGDHGSLLGHVARSNQQWRTPVVGEALMILHGPDAYISPSWYPSKAEHGRVVPTWDYLTAHVYGRLVVHDDPMWLESVVRRLTDKHEATSPRPWSVQDAPPLFIAAQLRGIVGLEVVISRVEAKAKWSQNRPATDIDGVIEGLEASGHAAAAAAVRSGRP